MAVRAVIATSCHTTGFKTKQSFTWMAFSDRFGSEEETGTVLHVVWHVSVSVRVPVGDGVRHCFMVFLLFFKKTRVYTATCYRRYVFFMGKEDDALRSTAFINSPCHVIVWLLCAGLLRHADNGRFSPLRSV